MVSLLIFPGLIVVILRHKGHLMFVELAVQIPEKNAFSGTTSPGYSDYRCIHYRSVARSSTRYNQKITAIILPGIILVAAMSFARPVFQLLVQRYGLLSDNR